MQICIHSFTAGSIRLLWLKTETDHTICFLECLIKLVSFLTCETFTKDSCFLSAWLLSRCQIAYTNSPVCERLILTGKRSCLACLQSAAWSPLTQVSCDKEQTAHPASCAPSQTRTSISFRDCRENLPLGPSSATQAVPVWPLWKYSLYLPKVLQLILKLTTNAKFLCLFQLCLLPA